jgi:hypothetical protein
MPETIEAAKPAPTERPEDGDPITRTSYTQTRDQTKHEIKTVNGHDVHVDVQTDTDDRLTGEFDDRVMRLIQRADSERQEIEDVRANRRNRNRFLTLVVALVMGFLTPIGLKWMGLAWLLPYAFAIILVPDAMITAWAYIKRY